MSTWGNMTFQFNPLYGIPATSDDNVVIYSMLIFGMSRKTTKLDEHSMTVLVDHPREQGYIQNAAGTITSVRGSEAARICAGQPLKLDRDLRIDKASSFYMGTFEVGGRRSQSTYDFADQIQDLLILIVTLLPQTNTLSAQTLQEFASHLRREFV